MRDKKGRFVKGLTPWNKGVPMSVESRRKESQSKMGHIPWNKGLSKDDQRIAKMASERSEEYREAIRNGRMENPASHFGAFLKKGSKPWNLGKHYRLRHSKQFPKGHVPWNKGKSGYHFKTEHLSEVHRAHRLKQIFPKIDTKPEKELQEFLNQYSISYLKHCPILGQPDIVVEGAKLAIFVDGCWWHGCEIHHAKLNERQILQKERDRAITRKLESEGWLVLRVWEHELKEGQEKILRILGVGEAEK